MSIRLETLSKKYLADYTQLLNDPAVRKRTQPYETFQPFAPEKLEAWLEKITLSQDRKDFAIVLADSGKLIGEIVLNEFQNNSANIRLAIDSRYWGQGYGAQAMDQALRIGFTELHLEQITLGVFDMNDRGLNLYRKLGFRVVSNETYEGYPETMMALSKADWAAHKPQS